MRRDIFIKSPRGGPFVPFCMPRGSQVQISHNTFKKGLENIQKSIAALSHLAAATPLPSRRGAMPPLPPDKNIPDAYSPEYGQQRDILMGGKFPFKNQRWAKYHVLGNRRRRGVFKDNFLKVIVLHLCYLFIYFYF